MSLNGIERSSILLMSVGVDLAVKVLKSFSIFEARKFLKCMININKVPSTEVNVVLQECMDFIHPVNYFSCIHGDYMFSILTKILGKKDATIFLKQNSVEKDINCDFKKLHAIDPNQLFNLIKFEHIQIITAILVHIKDCQAAKVLSFFPKKKRSEILLRIATFSDVTKYGKMELVKIVNNILTRYNNMISNKIAIKKAANILNLMNNNDKKSVVDNLFQFNTDLTKKILNTMFLFENLVNMQDEDIRFLVHHVNIDIICIGLQNADNVLKDKIMKNMSKKDAIYLDKKLSEKNSVLISDIKDAQKVMIRTMRSFLEKEGTTIEKNKVQ